MSRRDKLPIPSERFPSLVVAVDGPAGAGKTTLARRLAAELELAYVNTGLMYRALARAAIEEGVDVDDLPALARISRRLAFSITDDAVPELRVPDSPQGLDLYSDGVEHVVSAVARHAEVRDVMRAAQRALGARGAVMEGRDIGTAVFPDAPVKIYVTADDEVRARRRVLERGGDEEVAASLERRDALDARTNAPRPAEDAVVLDTTQLSEAEAYARALEIVDQKRIR